MSNNLRALVLAAAAYVGVVPLYRHLNAPQSPFTFDIGWRADAAYAPALPFVRPSERLGVFVAERSESAKAAMWYSAQYALVPAIVIPLYADVCLKTGQGPRCRLSDVDRVVSKRDPETIRTLQARFDFHPVMPAGDLVFCARMGR